MTSRSATAVLGVLVLLLAPVSPAAAEDYLDTRYSEVNFSPASSRSYVGSPSIVVLPNGDYLATHSDFGGGSGSNTTPVLRSRNGGVTWTPVEDSPVSPMFWATVFEHQGDVYLMGSSGEYGNAVIARSTDNGETWSEPVALLTGRYHTGDTPVLIHEGRVWKTFEENVGSGWAGGFRPLMVSADVNADLLDPASWTRTNNVERPWVLEGNPVVGPDGLIWNVLRWNESRSQGWVTKVDPANPSIMVDSGPITSPSA